MVELDWLLRRSRQVTEELAALPDWRRASLEAHLAALGKPRHGGETTRRPDAEAAGRAAENPAQA
jgi:hypothetical protein